MPLSHRIARTPYICARCTRRLVPLRPFSQPSPRPKNGLHTVSAAPAAYLPRRHRSTLRPSRLVDQRHAYTTTTTNRPFRIAIIGSGPAGFYTASRLLSKLPAALVDMYEQLPVPYGLVRFGVAPDHPEVKNCIEKFEEVASSPRFLYIGNVTVGRDVALKSLKPHYDAMLFSYGASEDRKLGIAGEDLKGVVSAREFVGWYNGLPQFQALEPALENGEEVVVIGQGNVALDVARILLTPVDKLRHTDITEQALETLSRSRVKSVRVVGRRGPLQAAFTVKEVRELMHIDHVQFEPINRSLYPPDIKKLPRVQKRIGEVMLKGTPPLSSHSTNSKSWALDFLKAPEQMNASSANSRQLSSIDFTHQTFAPDTDPFSKTAKVLPTEETSTLPASIAFRSVGYKSTAIPGLSDLGVPFDEKLGIIPNDQYGRIINPSTGPGSLTAGHVHGLYCAGWVKRGPTGVIASTMDDAFTSADVIIRDWESEVPFLNSPESDKSTGLGWYGVKDEVIARGVRVLDWGDWLRVDEMERLRGKNVGKEREKFVEVEDMLEGAGFVNFSRRG